MTSGILLSYNFSLTCSFHKMLRPYAFCRLSFHAGCTSYFWDRACRTCKGGSEGFQHAAVGILAKPIWSWQTEWQLFRVGLVDFLIREGFSRDFISVQLFQASRSVHEHHQGTWEDSEVRRCQVMPSFLTLISCIHRKGTNTSQHHFSIFQLCLILSLYIHGCIRLFIYAPLYTLDMQCLLITYTMSSYGKYTCCLACGVHVCDPPCGQSIVFGCFPFPSQARRRRAPLLCWRSREPEHHRRWTNWGWFE